MMVLCLSPIRCFQELDIQPLSHCPGEVMLKCSRKSKWAWELEETSLAGEGEGSRLDIWTDSCLPGKK